MVILIIGTSRVGKVALSNYLRATMNGVIVMRKPRCRSKEQLNCLTNMISDYSKVGDVVITDCGDLVIGTDGDIAKSADLVLVGRLNSNDTAHKLGIKHEIVMDLEPGLFYVPKQFDKVDHQTKEQIFTQHKIINVGDTTCIGLKGLS